MKILPAAAVMILTALPVWAADDPAISVCEEAIKLGLKAPKSYERNSATIAGDRVYIVYDAVNSYNAPLRDTQECEFTLGKDGKGEMIPLGYRTFKRKVEAFIEKTKDPSAFKSQEQLDKESQALQLEVLSQQMRAMTVMMTLQKTGNYPVDLATSQVRPMTKTEDALKLN